MRRAPSGSRGAWRRINRAAKSARVRSIWLSIQYLNSGSQAERLSNGEHALAAKDSLLYFEHFESVTRLNARFQELDRHPGPVVK
jgi:hypothetical protein